MSLNVSLSSKSVIAKRSRIDVTGLDQCFWNLPHGLLVGWEINLSGWESSLAKEIEETYQSMMHFVKVDIVF